MPKKNCRLPVMQVSLRVISLALFSLAWNTCVIAEENPKFEGDEKSSLDLAQDSQVEATKTTKTTKTKDKNQSVFKPSEEVSEDYAVPFPADI